ncbi:MAG: sulfatase-like hydrolase/transferase [Calditrichia bacterium]
METFAGFTGHTENEVGRLVDAIEEVGELDNTLFIYIMGDNGSSAEGGMIGTYNELINLNGMFGVETVEGMLAKEDIWGGPESFPHMAAGWAVATDVPFTWTKQIASDYGGTRNGMVMHWPDGFSSKGEIRSQWHHVIDVAPTLLEACKIPEPSIVNGSKQRPMDGVSMLYSTDNPEAEGQHTTQYFEMFGNRAIYNNGWLARVVHRFPWATGPVNSLQEDVWELYNAAEDFSLATNVANDHPEKLKEMKALFDEEAIRNNVYPLDDRVFERFNAKLAGRPDLMDGRTSLILAQGMSGIMENAFLNVKNTSITITAEVDLKGNDNGIILCQGGKFGGWALYMDDGKPTYTYNWFGLEQYTVQSTQVLGKGRTNIKLDFAYDGNGSGKGGMATIYVDNVKTAEGRIEKTQPVLFSADDTADVGMDEATQVVSKFKDVHDSKFTGWVSKVEISIK